MLFSFHHHSAKIAPVKTRRHWLWPTRGAEARKPPVVCDNSPAACGGFRSIDWDRSCSLILLPQLRKRWPCGTGWSLREPSGAGRSPSGDGRKWVLANGFAETLMRQSLRSLMFHQGPAPGSSLGCFGFPMLAECPCQLPLWPPGQQRPSGCTLCRVDASAPAHLDPAGALSEKGK